jgi:hypothetical protein
VPVAIPQYDLLFDEEGVILGEWLGSRLNAAISADSIEQNRPIGIERRQAWIRQFQT